MKRPQQEFPRWLYHPKYDGRIFNTAKEAKWSWIKGWRDKPFPPHNERFPAKAKAWWEKWEWAFKALIVILGVIAGVLALIRVLHAA